MTVEDLTGSQSGKDRKFREMRRDKEAAEKKCDQIRYTTSNEKKQITALKKSLDVMQEELQDEQDRNDQLEKKLESHLDAAAKCGLTDADEKTALRKITFDIYAQTDIDMDYFDQEEERMERARQEGNGRIAKQSARGSHMSSHKSVHNDSSTNFGTVQPNHGASLMVDIDAGLTHNRSVEVNEVI